MLQKHELGLKVVYLKDEKAYIVCSATLCVDDAGKQRIVYDITNQELTVDGPIVTHHDLQDAILCTVEEFKALVGEKLANL